MEETKNQAPAKVRRPRKPKEAPPPAPEPEPEAPAKRQRKPKEPKAKRTLSDAQRLALEKGRAKMMEKILEKKALKSVE